MSKVSKNVKGVKGCLCRLGRRNRVEEAADRGRLGVIWGEVENALKMAACPHRISHRLPIEQAQVLVGDGHRGINPHRPLQLLDRFPEAALLAVKAGQIEVILGGSRLQLDGPLVGGLRRLEVP